jgi:hypothetical protein
MCWIRIRNLEKTGCGVMLICRHSVRTRFLWLTSDSVAPEFQNTNLTEINLNSMGRWLIGGIADSAASRWNSLSAASRYLRSCLGILAQFQLKDSLKALTRDPAWGHSSRLAKPFIIQLSLSLSLSLSLLHALYFLFWTPAVWSRQRAPRFSVWPKVKPRENQSCNVYRSSLFNHFQKCFIPLPFRIIYCCHFVVPHCEPKKENRYLTLDVLETVYLMNIS